MKFSAAYIGGRLAFFDGKAPTDNPRKTARTRQEWRAGYDAAQAEGRRLPEISDREMSAAGARIARKLSAWAKDHL